MSEAKARDSKFEHIGEISPFVSEPYHFSYWCGSFLFVRLIPGHDITAYKYGKDKYDKLPYKDESLFYQPDLPDVWQSSKARIPASGATYR